MTLLLAATLLFLGLGVDDLGAQAVAATPVLADGDGQFWYNGRQLRRPLVVALPGEDAESCALRTVEFEAGDDGVVSPAVATANWEEGRCLARGWWEMGPTVGVQHAQARLPGATTSVTFQAVARQGARVFFGGAWTPAEDSWVRLVTPDDGPARLQKIDGSGVFRPILGVDFPLWPSWRRVRMAVGASADAIDRYFYFGLSGLQALVFGPGQESSAVDVHVGIQLSRRDVGVSGPACAPATLCTRRDLRFSGVALMLTIDGASAFRGLAGAVLR